MMSHLLSLFLLKKKKGERRIVAHLCCVHPLFSSSFLLLSRRKRREKRPQVSSGTIRPLPDSHLWITPLRTSPSSFQMKKQGTSGESKGVIGYIRNAGPIERRK